MEGTFDEAVQRYIRNRPLQNTVEDVSYLFEIPLEEAYEQALRDGRYCEYYWGSWKICSPDTPHEIPCVMVTDIIDKDPAKAVALDIETTGLDPGADEILSIAIIDGKGDTLFYSLIHPYRVTEWPEAQEINGISPLDVRDAPSIASVREDIRAILEDAEVVIGYNHTDFDMRFLFNRGIRYDGNWCDVMRDFTPIGEYIDGMFRYRSLVTCAEHYGYSFRAHDAVEDAKATLHCCLRIADEQRRDPELVRRAITDMRFGGYR